LKKKYFFYIRLKSKENLSAISGEKFPKIMNNRSKYYTLSLGIGFSQVLEGCEE